MCRYRPETCCIIGNYYSLKGDHRKAVRCARTLGLLCPTRSGADTRVKGWCRAMPVAFVACLSTIQVLYFARALRLDRRFLSAWTLMGHEYVELKQTEAAIEACVAGLRIDRAVMHAPGRIADVNLTTRWIDVVACGWTVSCM